MKLFIDGLYLLSLFILGLLFAALFSFLGVLVPNVGLAVFIGGLLLAMLVLAVIISPAFMGEIIRLFQAFKQEERTQNVLTLLVAIRSTLPWLLICLLAGSLIGVIAAR